MSLANRLYEEVREQENAPLMKQSGADSVITSSDAVGRLLGLSSLSPTLGSVMEDLLTYGEGLEVAERDLLVPEVGKPPQSLPDQVIAEPSFQSDRTSAPNMYCLMAAGVTSAVHTLSGGALM